MIPKESNEFKLWREVFILRDKYSPLARSNDEAFKEMVIETRNLYEKYKDTDAEVPALWCCHALREMFNEESERSKNECSRLA